MKTLILIPLLLLIVSCSKLSSEEDGPNGTIKTIPQSQWTLNWYKKDVGLLSIDTVAYINGKYVAVPIVIAVEPFHILSIYSAANWNSGGTFENYYNCIDVNGAIWQIPQKSLYHK